MRRALLALPLVVVLASSAWFTIPCRWIPVAQDPEFSGWVAPVSNRLATTRLYTDGMHSPLPPLPFVLLYAIGRGEAVWITESAVNVTLQAVTVLVLYAALVEVVPLGVAFGASLVALPIFLGSPKSLAYDAVAQCLLAIFGYLLVRWRREDSARWLGLAAITGGALLLSKHNTAIGALAGSVVALALVALPWRRRVVAVLVVNGGSLVAAAVMVLVLSPLVSPSGFVTDVLLTGSEPKGGPEGMLANLHSYGEQFLAGQLFLPVQNSALSIMLRACFITSIVGLAWTTVCRCPAYIGLAMLTAIFLPAAITHSLSGHLFRWAYDNNPMIVCAVAAPLLLLARWPRVTMGAATAAVVIAWAAYLPGLQQRLHGCTVPWPEVAAFRGARMPERAAGIRALIGQVKTYAPQPQDSVLLLPNDPDLASAFARPHPVVSSAILFVDQYWDRYVDEDYARLMANPPRVIVLGPNWNLWIQRFWGGEGRRTERLIGRVVFELLPAHYQLVDTKRFTTFGGTEDQFAIYAHR